MKESKFFNNSLLEFSIFVQIQKNLQVKKMFYYGYHSYLNYAFPLDELNPHKCCGRGPDYNNIQNININDVLGNYSLGLIDSLDTIAIMGDKEEFIKAVKLVISSVSFNQITTVQVFETTIRLLGSLISSHLILTEWVDVFKIEILTYDNELLDLARDLGTRLLPAFDNSLNLPYPRVNLKNGKSDIFNELACTAGMGTLVLEFRMLSRLTGDPIYESVAERAMDKLWTLKNNTTGLIGNVYNLSKQKWANPMSGIGAGIDSYYEYLLKSFILFGNMEDLKRFTTFYSQIDKYMKRIVTMDPMSDDIDNPIYYVNVDMRTGETINNWIDSLSAAFIGVQVLHGDIQSAIMHHALFYKLWLQYDGLPERYNWAFKSL